MNLDKLPILFVTFHPDSNFYSRIERLARWDLNIILYSNCSASFLSNELLASRLENVLSLGGEVNTGLSKAYNIVGKYLFELGFDRFVIFDQDTVIKTDFKLAIPVILSTKFDQFVILQLSSLANDSVSNDRQGLGIIETSFVINSGSLVNLNALDAVGWFDASFFVDLVDYELCLRSRYLGYKVGVFSSNFGIDHSSLQADSMIRVFGRSFYYRKYSVSRITNVFFGILRLVYLSLDRFMIRDVLSLMRFFLVFLLKNLMGLVFGERK